MGLLQRSLLGSQTDYRRAESLDGYYRRMMVLEQPDVAVFKADEGGSARFVTASASYKPPGCM